MPNIPFNNLKVVKDLSQATAEDVLIVPRWPEGEPALLSDNVADQCVLCKMRVQHRPNVPKEPRRVCLDCLPQFMAEEQAAGRVAKNEPMHVTEKSIEEFALYHTKPKGKA